MAKKIAFVFPGQGSQSLGMLSDLASHSMIVKQVFTEASEHLGYDLWDLTQNGPAEKLNQTIYTQPSLLAAGVAVWQVCQQQAGIKPMVMAGHSLGEYTALVCANVLPFSTAIKLVAKRAQLMQDAVPEGQGAMAAIVGLDGIKVQELCQAAANHQVVSAANYNAIGQVVIAGHASAVERAIALAQKAGAKIAKKIPVSVPSHCILMQHAANSLASYIEKIPFGTPTIPIINNVDVAITDKEVEIKDALVRQLFSPVRWVEIIQLMEKQGVELIIECGPGKVLAGLNKRITANINTISMDDRGEIYA